MDHGEKFEHDAIRRFGSNRHAHGPVARHQTRHRELPRPFQANLQVILFVILISTFLSDLSLRRQ